MLLARVVVRVFKDLNCFRLGRLNKPSQCPPHLLSFSSARCSGYSQLSLLLRAAYLGTKEGRSMVRLGQTGIPCYVYNE